MPELKCVFAFDVFPYSEFFTARLRTVLLHLLIIRPTLGAIHQKRQHYDHNWLRMWNQGLNTKITIDHTEDGDHCHNAEAFITTAPAPCIQERRTSSLQSHSQK